MLHRGHIFWRCRARGCLRRSAFDCRRCWAHEKPAISLNRMPAAARGAQLMPDDRCPSVACWSEEVRHAALERSAGRPLPSSSRFLRIDNYGNYHDFSGAIKRVEHHDVVYTATLDDRQNEGEHFAIILSPRVDMPDEMIHSTDTERRLSARTGAPPKISARRHLKPSLIVRRADA